MLTATHAGTTATYAYWPDGTRRSTTTSGSGAASTQTFHYGTDGTLVNDTTADATTGAAATTASYLLTAGREARTLQPGTTTTGALPTRCVSTVTTGTGAGYLLRDRHSSVTALIDTTGAVTDTYHYSDYGPPAQPNGQSAPSSSPALGGQANPFQYTGATPVSSMTDPTTGLLLLPARSYDPTQGRFTSRDTANVFNHYQAFSTNPIAVTDTTGHFSLTDLLIDIGAAILFAVVAVATAGAALTALPAVIGAEAGPPPPAASPSLSPPPSPQSPAPPEPSPPPSKPPTTSTTPSAANTSYQRPTLRSQAPSNSLPARSPLWPASARARRRGSDRRSRRSHPRRLRLPRRPERRNRPGQHRVQTQCPRRGRRRRHPQSRWPQVRTEDLRLHD